MGRVGAALLCSLLVVSCTESPIAPEPGADVISAAAEDGSADSSVLQATCSLPPFPSTQQTVFQTDVTYNVIAGQVLRLDFAVQRNPSSPRPLVVLIHGGGWDSGTKKAHRNDMIRLTSLGYAAATIDYRLAPKHVFPAQIQDVACAISWLRANAGRYGIDPNRVAVVGHSAGGELAALYGVAGHAGALHGPCSVPSVATAVEGVVAFSTPFDVTSTLLSATAKQKVIQYLGGTPTVQKWAGVMASPLFHASLNSPPFLMAHAVGDPVVPVQESVAMAKRLTSKGIPNTLLKLSGSLHDILLMNLTPPWDVSTCGMLGFLKGVLKP
ncbi:MAG: alpha/beta hydrolase [Gemmatimonadetes bacterium]|nr:alpha/beta hydrolase [Gemmatimonadota bacterium]